VQLDHIPLRRHAELSRTAEDTRGVDTDEARGVEAAPARAEAPPAAPVSLRRPRAREWIAVALVAFSLFGVGERCRVDARLASPGATLRTYWEALRLGDADGAAECLAEEPGDLPFPGMLWFLPEAADLELDGFRSLPVSAGHVLVTYEVRYRPPGETRAQSFQTGSELVRMRGEWRIVRGLGEANMPEWKPRPRTFDS
jgi:hypothetical protein